MLRPSFCGRHNYLVFIRLIIGLELGLGVLAVHSPGAPAKLCEIRMPRPANAFFVDERIEFTLSFPGSLRYVWLEVRDYQGRLRWQGGVRVGGEQPVAVRLPSLPVGYYRLRLSWTDGAQEEPFCVLPRPYSDPGDYALFGLEIGSGAYEGPIFEQKIRLAAQMGVRLLRYTIAWPPLEPQRGVWADEILSQAHTWANRYGLQMMIVLGYTPSFASQRACNIDPQDWWANAAAFTWHVRDHAEFARYLARLMTFGRGKIIRWPATEFLPATGGGPTPQSLPWIHSFEMWNEGDHCFYLGDWNRFMDMLRLSWAASRLYLPGTLMINGASTGNWPAMGMLASGAGIHCQDFLSLHAGGALEDCLRVWYSGAQQIPWCVGAPRETFYTECYAQGRPIGCDYRVYQERPAELLRTYITLKAWREMAYFRSGCLGGFVGSDTDWAPGTALIRKEPSGKLTPTPLYPAFAAARKLLSDAVEVGPLQLGKEVTAHLFLKHGRPLLTAWSDGAPLIVRFRVLPTLTILDYYGNETPLPGRTVYYRRLDATPLVLRDVDGGYYLPEALRRRYELFTRTSYGTLQTNPACWIWYAPPMQEDLEKTLGQKALGPLDAALEQAAQALASGPAAGVPALLAAQNECWQLMDRLLRKCPRGEAVPKPIANNLWRLARIDEWLGAIIDELSDQSPGVAAPARTSILALQSWPERMTRAIYSQHGAAELPVAGHLLQRCRWQLGRLNQYQRQGTYNAIYHKVCVVSRLNFIEKATVLRVVPVLDFTTACLFLKASVFRPGQQHIVTASVYNYLEYPVSGTLRIKFPAAWEPAEASCRFAAAAGAASAPIPISVTLPSEPRPWITTQTFTLAGMLNVSLPPSLADRPQICVSGILDSGEPLAEMTYYVNVGQWLDDPQNGSTTVTQGFASAAAISPAASPFFLPLTKALQEIRWRVWHNEQRRLAAQ